MEEKGTGTLVAPWYTVLTIPFFHDCQKDQEMTSDLVRNHTSLGATVNLLRLPYAVHVGKILKCELSAFSSGNESTAQ